MNAELVKEPRAKIVDQSLARRLLQDGGEHVSRPRIIDEVGTRLVFDVEVEKGAAPVAILGREAVDGIVLMTAVHRQQIADAHGL